MTDEIYNDMAMEKAILSTFRKKLDIKQIVVSGVPTSRTSEATLFLTENNQVYLYVRAEASMILDDVRKITHRMGLEAEEFCPPGGDKHYFDDVGAVKFKSVFPGRSAATENDIRFYKLLAPYNPALVKILAVKTGEIKQYDVDSGQWRHAARYSYRKVKPSS
jgi:hypothetical protein